MLDYRDEERQVRPEAEASEGSLSTQIQMLPSFPNNRAEIVASARKNNLGEIFFSSSCANLKGLRLS